MACGLIISAGGETIWALIKKKKCAEGARSTLLLSLNLMIIMVPTQPHSECSLPRRAQDPGGKEAALGTPGSQPQGEERSGRGGFRARTPLPTDGCGDQGQDLPGDVQATSR